MSTTSYDMHGPLITVGVPTFNRATYLEQCIASIRQQTYENIDILIADNASTDETHDLLKRLTAVDPRIRVIRHETNVGMVRNFNAVLRAALGEYFLLVSDDDLLSPQAVERLLGACRKPTVEFAYGATAVIDGDGQVRDFFQGGPPTEEGTRFIRAHLLEKRTVALACTMYRIGEPAAREYFDEVVGSVSDLLQRLVLASRGNVASVPHVLAFYRVHENSLTANVDLFAGSLFRFVDAGDFTNGRLKEFRGLAREYAVKRLNSVALSAAVRGRSDVALETARVMEKYGAPTRALRLTIRLASNVIIRRLAASRRERRAQRAARLAARFTMRGDSARVRSGHIGAGGESR